MHSVAENTLKVDNPASIKLGVGLSHAFTNKPDPSTVDKKLFGSSFTPSLIPVHDFIAHVTIEGKAWTQGFFNGNTRRKDTFVSAQTLALDIDNTVEVDALDAQGNIVLDNGGKPKKKKIQCVEGYTTFETIVRDPFIKQHAAFVHPSPSSTPNWNKTRVVFILSEPVTSADQWETLQRALIAYFAHWQPDPACKDAARLFYGSTQQGAVINENAVLPLSVVGGLTFNEALADMESALTILAKGTIGEHEGHGGELSPALIADVEQRLGVRGARTKASGFTSNFRCPIRHHEHDDTNPGAAYHAEKHFVHCFKCGEDYTIHQTAAAFGIDTKPYYRKAKRSKRSVQARERKESALADQIRPFELKTLTADMTVNMRYVSDVEPGSLPHTGALLVVSAIGTGKTELVKRIIDNWQVQHGYTPRVCVVTHRQALASDIAENRLKMECYKAFRGELAQYLPSVQQLVLCYNSAPKLIRRGAPLSEYDLLIIDEIEQFHSHLDGDTFKKGEAQLAYEVLRQLVKSAGVVIGLDAHATDISRAWLKELKGQVYTLANTYQRQHNRMVIHADKNETIETAFKLVDANKGCVVIPCGGKDTAKAIHELFSAKFGKDAGFLVCGDNSEGDKAQTFIKEINTRIQSLRWLVHTTSLGTGVDITEPVRAVVVICARNLPAPDIMQMAGRCRNTEETHIYAPNSEGHEEENPNAIYARHEQNALKTAGQCAFDEHGILGVTPTQQAILRLLSMLEAERNRSKNNLLGHLTALAKAANYPLEFCEGKAGREFADQLKQAAADLAAAQKDAVLNATPISHEELDVHRDKGTLTDEIRAGHEHFKIIDTVGLPTLTPVIYDDLHTPTKRAQLVTFTDLQTPIDELRESDRQEAHNGHLLNKRKHRLMRRTLVHQAICDGLKKDGVDGSLDFKGSLTGQEIAANLEGFLILNRADLRTYFNRRDDKSENPVAILRWLLDKAGVKLCSRQVMRDGQRFMEYFLDHEHIATWQGYAAARRAHLAKILASKKPLLKSGIDIIVPNCSVQPKSTPPPSPYDDLAAQAALDAAWGVAASAGIVKA